MGAATYPVSAAEVNAERRVYFRGRSSRKPKDRIPLKWPAGRRWDWLRSWHIPCGVCSRLLRHCRYGGFMSRLASMLLAAGFLALPQASATAQDPVRPAPRTERPAPRTERPAPADPGRQTERPRPEARRAEPQRAEPRRAEPQRTEPQRPEPRRAEPRREQPAERRTPARSTGEPELRRRRPE